MHLKFNLYDDWLQWLWEVTPYICMGLLPIYRIRGFFTPLNFHEFHKFFWIREIKFVKCCRNVIAILVAILKFLVKTYGFVKI